MTRPARDLTERTKRHVPMPEHTTLIRLDADLPPGEIRRRALNDLKRQNGIAKSNKNRARRRGQGIIGKRPARPG